jgi:hypothetical protein
LSSLHVRERGWEGAEASSGRRRCVRSRRRAAGLPSPLGALESSWADEVGEVGDIVLLAASDGFRPNEEQSALRASDDSRGRKRARRKPKTSGDKPFATTDENGGLAA